jgi:hypothetical protein
MSTGDWLTFFHWGQMLLVLLVPSDCWSNFVLLASIRNGVPALHWLMSMGIAARCINSTG